MRVYILNIETSTKACSVALHKNGELIVSREDVTTNFSHSEKLLKFISELFSDAKLSLSDLDAIAVSMGPGSYTGLRIGVSTAKGLCYGLDIPLISISTLKAMSFGMALEIKADLYCPMIDARRMEVYSAFFDIKNTEIRKIQADIIDENSYKLELEKKVVFFGDGSEKIKEKWMVRILSHLDFKCKCCHVSMNSFDDFLSHLRDPRVFYLWNKFLKEVRRGTFPG